jgi:hypothetical protein
VIDSEKQNNQTKQIRHYNDLQHLGRERGENRDDPLLPTIFTGEVIDNADRYINTILARSCSKTASECGRRHVPIKGIHHQTLQQQQAARTVQHVDHVTCFGSSCPISASQDTDLTESYG